MGAHGNVYTHAAHTLLHGGLALLPMPEKTWGATVRALGALEHLHALRKTSSASLNEAVWGYEVDDKGQFNKGLSQWRSDERKTVFHYSPAVPEVLREQGAPVGSWHSFFDPSLIVFETAYALGMKVIAALDGIMPGYHFADSCFEAGVEQQYLRYLVYDPRAKGESETATSHQDRCFLTVHLYESAPGLYVGDSPHTHVRVGVPHRMVGLFLGRKASQMTDNKLCALWHGTHEVRALEPQGRRAAVLFMHTNVPLIRRPGELT